MNKISYISFILAYFLVLNTSSLYGDELSENLILNDINDYSLSSDPICGQGSGILIGADHFYIDHQDSTCGISYFNIDIRTGAEVQVTIHTGSGSDQWLMHEMEKSFRAPNNNEGSLGLPYSGSRIVTINNNNVFRYWSEYRWISNYAFL